MLGTVPGKSANLVQRISGKVSKYKKNHFPNDLGFDIFALKKHTPINKPLSNKGRKIEDGMPDKPSKLISQNEIRSDFISVHHNAF